MPVVLCTIAALAMSADALAKSSLSHAAAEPSPAAQVLALEEGVWDAEIEFPAAAPGAAPVRAHGVQTNAFVTGRGWIKNDFVVDANYGGHGTWGYDPRKGKYVGVWVDSNQDYLRIDEGSYDAATQTMTWTSELRQPEPYPPAAYRMVEQFRGDRRVLTMTAIGAKSGKEVPLGTITFTRRAAAASR